MAYDYNTEKAKLMTPQGFEKILNAQNHIDKLFQNREVITMQEAMKGNLGDSWEMMAAVDFLLERGDIIEVPQSGYVAGQNRIFRKA